MITIRKKRVDTTAIVVINGKIYTRNGVDDKLWIEISDLCEDLMQTLSQEEFDAKFDALLDLVDISRLEEKAKAAQERQEAIENGQLEMDFDKRMKQAKRIADISGLFEYDEEGLAYLKGFKYPMPKVMVESLLDANYNPNSKYTVDSLVNFWKYLLLNPDKHVRKGLFDWVKTGNFALTEDGNIISYRNVEVKTKGSNKKQEDFISESWTKVKKWKKSPKNYSIIKDAEGLKCVENDKVEDKSKSLGSLAALYEDTDSKETATVYTDQHTRTMEITIGNPVAMPRSECDNDPKAACSRGLHQKSAAHGMGFGSNSIVCLVSPYHVVAIPSYDSTKFRTCQYLPVSKSELDERGKIVEFDNGTYDIPYNGLENLVDMLKTKSLKELQDSGEISEELETADFDFIMTEARNVIKERVVKLDD